MSESLTRTQSLIANDFLPKSWKHTKKKRNKNISGLAWRDVGTFISSVDGLLGREATIFSKCLPAKVAAKWQRTYSEVCGSVHARLSIAIVCATHLCI
jgi:hypothetical protein